MTPSEQSDSYDIEDVREALKWALTYIEQRGAPEDGDGEEYDDYSGATRLAWPTDPECWS